MGGGVGGRGVRCCAGLPVQPPHLLHTLRYPPCTHTVTQADVAISIFIGPQLLISHPCYQQQLHMDYIWRRGGDVKEGRGWLESAKMGLDIFEMLNHKPGQTSHALTITLEYRSKVVEREHL